MENHTKNNNSLNIFKELFTELISLIYQHYLLIKREFRENAERVVKSVILILASIIISYAGLIFLGILLIYLLSLIIPSWAALLLITGIYLGIPLIMFIYAIHLIGRAVKEPGQIMEEIQKTGEETEKWLKNIRK